MKKHLLIDGQIFQSIARHRGMGRYSEYLLNAIIEQNKYRTTTVILSSNSTPSKSEDMAIFKNVETKYLNLVDSSTMQLNEAEIHNKEVIDNYIDSLGIKRVDIDFLLLAPFQEPLVSIFPASVNKFLVFYDLIPYLYHEQYIHKMPFEKYLTHYKLLFEADLLLAISDSVKNDLCTYLGIPEEKIVAIHGAAIRSNLKPKEVTAFNVPKKFILMPTGDDPRKNNAKGVEGFEVFNAQNNGTYKLLITSNIHYIEKANLEKLSNNIIFTGNIDEAELDWLYDKAQAVLFVSESEGLGLPVLEAVGAGSQVACSSLDVFKEISKNAFHYCDQTSEYSIAKAISSAVNKNIDEEQKEEYRKILTYYSWSQTATRSISAMQSLKRAVSTPKERIAVFTPKPDGISAIGKVVAETHPVLAQYFDIDYFFEEGPVNVSTRPNYLQYIANYYPATNFSLQSYAEYDAVFYHIGNSEYHLQSIANSLYLPGYVVIHDTNISDAYKVMAEKDVISNQRADLEAEITRTGSFTLSNNLASIITNQIGAIVHSDYALNAVKEISKEIPAERIDLPTATPPLLLDREYKTLSLGLAGIIADIKGTEVLERLVNNHKHEDCKFLLFGYNYSSDSTMKRLKSYDNVSVETNVSDQDFVKKMKQLDIFVNYRMKYQGETSLSTLEAMRQGVVVIVRNVGWYSELPDDVVIKVDSIQEVERKIADLIKNPTILKDISTRALEYLRQRHNHHNYALGMRALIERSQAVRSNNRVISERIKSGKLKTKAGLLKERDL
ncbi:MAG: glycosyltransferase [Candidatus Saccharimonas sp.]